MNPASEACEELIGEYAWDKLQEHDQLMKAGISPKGPFTSDIEGS